MYLISANIIIKKGFKSISRVRTGTFFPFFLFETGTVLLPNNQEMCQLKVQSADYYQAAQTGMCKGVY